MRVKNHAVKRCLAIQKLARGKLLHSYENRPRKYFVTIRFASRTFGDCSIGDPGTILPGRVLSATPRVRHQFLAAVPFAFFTGRTASSALLTCRVVGRFPWRLIIVPLIAIEADPPPSKFIAW